MSIRPDVVYAIRLLRRSPLFTTTAVASLAVGLAANAAIFSLADAVLFRQRPGISDPARLVDVGRTQGGSGFDTLSYPNYVDLRDRSRALSGLAVFANTPTPIGLGVGEGAERVYGMAVSGNYFDVLGVRMARGRGFRPEEDRVGAAPVVVIGHELWRTRYGASPALVGTTIRVNGRVFTIVGVAPEGFGGSFFTAADLWMPLPAYLESTGRAVDMLTSRVASWLVGVGRLRPDVTVGQAQAEMSAIAADLVREYPGENEGRGVTVTTSHRIPGFLRPIVGGFVALLFALVGLVLAIACTNLAGMLLARGVTRAREVAVRLAVGAGRARIVRQLVTESLLLALAGCALGVLGAAWMIRLLQQVRHALPVPVALDLRLDWRVVGFSVTLAIVTGLLFGLMPALQAARTDLVSTLKADGAPRGPRRTRLRQAFVVAQLAMSVLLVVAALLLGRSLRHAGAIDRGFDPRGVDVAELDLRLGGYTPDTGPRVAQQILSRVARLPGVESAAFARVIPLTGSGLGLGRLSLPGQPRDPRAPDPLRADWNIVTPAYFATMRTRIVAGRPFGDADRAGTPDVAIVNETFARRAWSDGGAVGRILLQDAIAGRPPRELHVVGVTEDGKYRSLGEEPRAFVYVPHAQQYTGDLALLVRRGDGSALPEVRAAIRQVDPYLPLTHASTLEDATAIGLLPQRLAAAVAGGFGFVGLLLASMGIYGITAFSVTQRTREIGVRMALGATRSGVVRLVVGQSMRMAMPGVVIGLAVAAGAAQLLRGLLYGIAALDPVSFGGGAALFCALALAASWWPARRAAALSPAEALRTD
jgi:predicted permease